MISFWLIIAANIVIFLSFVITPVRRNNKILLTILFVVPVSAFLLYLHLGASDKLAQASVYKQRLAEVKMEIKKLGTRRNVIKTLKEKIDQQPNDPKGWFLLGKLYYSGGEFELAGRAFSKANSLKPGDVDIMLGMVMTQFYADGEKLTPDSRELLNKVLGQQKDNVNALNLLAVDAFNQAHYKLAVQYWEQILPLFPADSEDAKLLLKMIAKAQARA